MAQEKLTAAEIEKGMADLSDWTVSNEKLIKRFTFKNFAASLEFINRIGVIAERLDHHPDILFGWGYVEIFITTHDAGGITQRDFALAKAIDSLTNN